MQSITTRFHRSIYITLGLACACLGYAELPFLPEMSAFAALVAVLLVVAYWLEGRWALSIRAANVLGGVIAFIAVVWVANQFLHPSIALFDQLPSPTWMLPYLGPLLMILIPAKLFRPKHDGDFWGLQGIGLIAVSLGCALTGDPLFGVLLLAYVVSGLWSLTLFYYYRQVRLAGGGRMRPAVPPRSFRQASRWSVAASALAIGMFLCTPRATDARWELAGTSFRLQTGVDDNRPGIDLNRSGTLTVNREKVIDVIASTDMAGERRKTDLDPGQRWRQMVFDSYSGGKWDNRPAGGVNPDLRFSQAGNAWREFDAAARQPRPLPDLGTGQYYLHFNAHARGMRRLCAEPRIEVIGPEGRPISTIVSVVGRDHQFPWSRSNEGEVSPPAFVFGGHEHTYRQVVRPLPEPGVGQPFPPGRPAPDEGQLDHLRECGAVPDLADWTRALVQRLVAEGRLPAPIGEAASKGRLSEEHYEAVGRAFEDYLARSGEFRYSLTLRRKDNQVDPIEDFVLNTRTGHCTRFATALALMLRSVGVPTRIVLGFRGFETAGDGLYEVLQCHAHAWVEALIVRPRGQPDESKWRWLTLDPTPAGEDTAGGEFSWAQLWEQLRQQSAGWFKNFVIEYDADQQERARHAVTQGDWGFVTGTRRIVLGPGGDDWTRAALIAVGGLTAIALVWRAVRRFRTARRRPIDAAFYARLLTALRHALGLSPEVGQTPGEFTAVAAERLRSAGAPGDLADVPGATAELYYRVRFGDRPLTPAERQGIDARLDRLEASLASGRGS